MAGLYEVPKLAEPVQMAFIFKIELALLFIHFLFKISILYHQAEYAVDIYILNLYIYGIYANKISSHYIFIVPRTRT